MLMLQEDQNNGEKCFSSSWIAEKGFGFIERGESGGDVFVHSKNLTSGITALEEGQKVEFDLVQGGKGDMAQNVSVTPATSSSS